MKKALAYGAAAVLLLAVFALYTQPRVIIGLADMVWACFQ